MLSAIPCTGEQSSPPHALGDLMMMMATHPDDGEAVRDEIKTQHKHSRCGPLIAVVAGVFASSWLTGVADAPARIAVCRRCSSRASLSAVATMGQVGGTFARHDRLGWRRQGRLTDKVPPTDTRDGGAGAEEWMGATKMVKNGELQKLLK